MLKLFMRYLSCNKLGNAAVKYSDKGDLTSFSELVAMNPSAVDARNYEGTTPLHRACMKGNVAMVCNIPVTHRIYLKNGYFQ